MFLAFCQNVLFSSYNNDLHILFLDMWGLVNIFHSIDSMFSSDERQTLRTQRIDLHYVGLSGVLLLPVLIFRKMECGTVYNIVVHPFLGLVSISVLFLKALSMHCCVQPKMHVLSTLKCNWSLNFHLNTTKWEQMKVPFVPNQKTKSKISPFPGTFFCR
jgi:hypothetical protein